MTIGSYFARAALVLVTAVLLVGGATAQQACPRPAISAEVGLMVSPRAENGLIADAAVQLAAPASVYVEYGNDQAGWLRTPTTELGTNLSLTLYRLRADTAYQARAFALDGGGCPAMAAATDFKSGPLPDPLRSSTVELTGQASFPLSLMDWPNILPFLPPEKQIDRSRFLAALDRDGQIVWYFPVPKEYQIPPPEASTYLLKQQPNGNFLFLSGYGAIDEVTPDGKVVRHFQSSDPVASRPHHDLVELPDGRVLYLGAEDRKIDDTRNGGPSDLVMRGDTLHIADLNTGEVQQVWNAFDSLDPTERIPAWQGWKIQGVLDWTHANAMGLGPSGNVIVSLRHLDQIISLAPDFKTIQWKLGGPGSSFGFADPGDRFHGQHGVVELPNGHLLMFDNGNYREVGEFTRGLELELDFQTMTAHKVWEYRPQPDIFSDKLGNVLRLPNGNTMISFGWRQAPDEPALIQEIQPDGTVAWSQSMRWKGIPAVRFRAYPLTSIGGETTVSPTLANVP